MTTEVPSNPYYSVILSFCESAQETKVVSENHPNLIPFFPVRSIML